MSFNCIAIRHLWEGERLGLGLGGVLGAGSEMENGFTARKYFEGIENSHLWRSWLLWMANSPHSLWISIFLKLLLFLLRPSTFPAGALSSNYSFREQHLVESCWWFGMAYKTCIPCHLLRRRRRSENCTEWSSRGVTWLVEGVVLVRRMMPASLDYILQALLK